MAEKVKKEKIIGIDLGTSNSAAAVLQAGKSTIIPSAEGTSAYGKAEKRLARIDDRMQVFDNPDNSAAALTEKEKEGTGLYLNS